MIRAAVAALLLALPADAQERVAIAGGDLTEIAYALGAGDRLAAVDVTSTHPPQADALPDMGYLRRLAPEGVLSVAPDLLLAAHDAGPETALERIAAAGVRVLRGPAPEGAPEAVVAAKIAFVGAALGREAEAEALAARVTAELGALREALDGAEGRPRVLFLLAVPGAAPMAAGRDSSAARIVELAGGINAIDLHAGYRPVSAEAILAAAPDVVLMTTAHAEAIGGPAQVLARPELAGTPAGRAGRLVTMDGLLLLGFGPRTPEAAARLARALHPDLAGRLP